jgi:hypothetical protein
VKRLVINGPGLLNLEGIQQFPALTHLEIELEHARADLAPLRSLANLQCLRIITRSNAMLGLLRLSGLQNLRMLQIRQPRDTLVNLVPFEGNMDLTVVVVPDLQLMTPKILNIIEIGKLPPMV